MTQRHRLFLLAALILLLISACIAALAEEPLPEAIRAYFEGADVTGTAHWSDTGSKDTWFVLVRAKNGTNTLHCFTPKDGVWTRRFFTDAAIPQGKNTVTLYTAASVTDWPTDKHIDGPLLIISQLDEGDEYTELFTAYKRSDAGQWNLIRIWSYIGYGNMEIGSGSITYYRGLEDTRVAGTVRGTFQRDLRYVRLETFPKTLAEARQKLTSAPALPAGSGLAAQDIQFTGGQQYAVYSAPDKNALRGGNGKAKVSTNGWIQVFGRENDWILIQYSIDSGHYRFGYIDAAALPKKAEVPDLAFGGIRAVTLGTAEVTDDPLFSQSLLTTLAEGEEVTWLSTLGDWAYIEGAGFRGFVPVTALDVPAAGESFTVYTDGAGTWYDLFEIRRLHYDAGHRVYAVTGVYERAATVDGIDTSETAEEGALFTYPLAADFRAMMAAPDSRDPMEPYVPADDLYSWYIGAYLDGQAPENGELTFLYDLPEDQRENAETDFWFVTVRVRLNENNEIEYMEYFYVPWG